MMSVYPQEKDDESCVAGERNIKENPGSVWRGEKVVTVRIKDDVIRE